MNNKFMHPSKPSESDLIIKGYRSNQNIYLEYKQNIPIYESNAEVINDLFSVFKINSYEFKFNDIDHGFFEEFIYSCSLLENVENGISKTLAYIERALSVITEEEKSLKAFSEFEIARNIFLLSKSTKDDIYNYLSAFSVLCNNLEYMSIARSYFRYKFNRIHTDHYSAQEHFKKIILPIHLHLKSLGFKKKAFKFIQLDKENELERVILLQKSRSSLKEELSFTINFCIRPVGIDTNYERLGNFIELESDDWFTINISINDEKTTHILEYQIDKVLKIIMNCNTLDEYIELREVSWEKYLKQIDVKRNSLKNKDI